MSFLHARMGQLLDLAPGARLEVARVDVHRGDYRVIALALSSMDSGGELLTLELHREAPSMEHCLFPALWLTVGAPLANGSCAIDQCFSDGDVTVADMDRYWPYLTQIALALRHNQQPDDRLLLPFLSRRGQLLWTKPLRVGVVS
jgi:hypothetical protein